MVHNLLFAYLVAFCRVEFFKEAGEVVDVRLATSEGGGRRRGFCHAEFASAEGAQKVSYLFTVFKLVCEYHFWIVLFPTTNISYIDQFCLCIFLRGIYFMYCLTRLSYLNLIVDTSLAFSMLFTWILILIPLSSL